MARRQDAVAGEAELERTVVAEGGRQQRERRDPEGELGGEFGLGALEGRREPSELQDRDETRALRWRLGRQPGTAADSSASTMPRTPVTQGVPNSRARIAR
jgi:hypothetical protein